MCRPVPRAPRKIMPFLMSRRKASRSVRSVSSSRYTARRKPSISTSMPPSVMVTHYETVEIAGPAEPLGTPVWKPFLNRLETVLRYRIRPVPVTFLRFAFSDQLSAPYPSAVSLKLSSTDGRKPTLADLSSRVAARSASLLLVVERPATNKAIPGQFLPGKTTSRDPLRPTLGSSRLFGSRLRVDLPASLADTVGLVVAGKSCQTPLRTSERFNKGAGHTACQSWRYPSLLVCVSKLNPPNSKREGASDRCAIEV